MFLVESALSIGVTSTITIITSIVLGTRFAVRVFRIIGIGYKWNDLTTAIKLSPMPSLLVTSIITGGILRYTSSRRGCGNILRGAMETTLAKDNTTGWKKNSSCCTKRCQKVQNHRFGSPIRAHCESFCTHRGHLAPPWDHAGPEIRKTAKTTDF